MGPAMRSSMRHFFAVSRDRATSLAPLGRMESSYAVTASFKDTDPDADALTASTSSAASWIALFNPCPRSFHWSAYAKKMGR